MSRERSWQEELFLAAMELAPGGDEGRIYAAHFGNFLRGLMGQGVINDWRETEKNSPDDRKGVDFWIAVEAETFGFQITSTRQNAQQRIEKHPGVYSLWLRSSEGLKSDERLREELLAGMSWYRARAAKGKVMFGYRSGELSIMLQYHK